MVGDSVLFSQAVTGTTVSASVGKGRSVSLPQDSIQWKIAGIHNITVRSRQYVFLELNLWIKNLCLQKEYKRCK